MSKKLKPIKTEEEVEKYEAFSEKKTISFGNCNHKKAKIKGSELRCVCGAVWTGPRIGKLLKLLKT